MMNHRDQEQYASLLQRIAPHCLMLTHDRLSDLLRTPLGAARSAVRDDIFWAFARSAAKAAETYKSCGGCDIPYEDLASEAFIALIKAIDTFDSDRIGVGPKFFAAYAHTGMRRAIIRYSAETGRIVRVPRRSGPPAITAPIDSVVPIPDKHAPPDALCITADDVVAAEIAISATDGSTRDIIRAQCGLSDDDDAGNVALQARRRGVTRQALHLRVKNNTAKFRAAAQALYAH